MSITTSSEQPERSNTRRRSSRRTTSRQKRLPSKYHKLAFKSKLGAIWEGPTEEDISESHDHDTGSDSVLRYDATPDRSRSKSERLRSVHEAKMSIIADLAQTGGDASSKAVLLNLQKLTANYDASTSHFDPRALPRTPEPFSVCGKDATRLEGTWMTLSKPNFKGCLGTNENGDYLYTLGQMAFGKLLMSSLYTFWTIYRFLVC